MTAFNIKLPRSVLPSEWAESRKTMRKREEEFRRERQNLISKWKSMPMVKMVEGHLFQGPNGSVNLVELFCGRRQLLVYHFWFQPGKQPCPGCSLWTSDLGDMGGNFANLRNYDTSLAFVSRASSDEIEAVRKKRNWTIPWYSMPSEDFNDATGYSGWAQISVFVREGSAVFLANVVAFEDLSTIGNHWTLLERTPLRVKEE